MYSTMMRYLDVRCTVPLRVKDGIDIYQSNGNIDWFGVSYQVSGVVLLMELALTSQIVLMQMRRLLRIYYMECKNSYLA